MALTIDEFKKLVESGKVFYCETYVERNDLIRFMRSIGYKLGDTIEGYANSDSKSEEFLSPFFKYGRVECYKNRAYDNFADRVVRYDEVSHLFEDNMEPIPEEEFKTAFATMLGIRV